MAAVDKRHNDAAQNAPIAQAVNKSSFLQLVRAEI